MKKLVFAAIAAMVMVSVKKVRLEKGLSQEALGKYVGLGKSSISKIESGKTNISVDK